MKNHTARSLGRRLTSLIRNTQDNKSLAEQAVPFDRSKTTFARSHAFKFL